MKNNILYKSALAVLSLILIIWTAACTRDFDELEKAKYPDIAEVFIDGFSQGLNYAAFGGSKVTAFDVDEEVAYSGSASMRIEIPDAGDPEGSYAGGVYYTTIGRDLSSYDALTFWAKASKAATIDVVGISNDLGEATYQASISGLQVNSNWKKYIIPIPDASKLIAERGMFYYSEGPEEGLGYTIWFDEVKYEKLGTIAHKKAIIMDGTDKTESVVNGLSFPVSGLGISFNMPTGIDQMVNVGPAYFSFTSSNASVASVDEMGMVDVLSAGTTTITASTGDLDAEGSLTVQSMGDFTHAPDPTQDAEDVISIFSDAYTNVPVDFFNGYWEPHQTTLSADFTVNDDEVLNYTNFNFVGIQFATSPVDGSSMTHLHMDVYIPNAVDPADKLKVTVKDMGPDGVIDTGDDYKIEYFVPTPMASQSWISVDIDLSGLAGKSKLAQLVLENDGTGLAGFYLDNVYFYGDGGGTPTGPTSAAPTPDEDQADVISLFSDAYTDVTVDTWRTDWSTATLEDVTVAGNAAKKYSSMNVVGISTETSMLDVTGMTHFHIDVWSADFTQFSVKLVDFGADGSYAGGDDVEHQIDYASPTQGQWISYDIPLTDFTGLTTKEHIAQYLLLGQPSGATTVWVDNVYFYNSAGGATVAPTDAPPTPPAKDPADVISIYGEAYGAEIGLTNVGWDGATEFVEETIAGNKLLKVDFETFLGTSLGSVVDATEMTHFHMDFWIADDWEAGQVFNPKWSDHAGGAGQTSSFELTKALGAGDVKTWVSVDVPITDFTGDYTRANLTEFLITVASKIDVAYVDNIYFYKDGGGSATEPTVAAPTPDEDPGDVISLFSDAYTDVTVDTWRTDWSTATLEDVTVAGNAAKKYSSLNVAGISTESSMLDVTGMTHFHIDVWSADFTQFSVKLVDFGADGAYGGGDDVEHVIDYASPAQGQWISYDIPLTDFTGLTSKEHIAQYLLIGQPTGATTVWLDNVYFYNEGGSTATEPTTAAPTPDEDPGDVISLFSDAYTDVTVDTWRTDWSTATLEDVTVAGNAAKKYSSLDVAGISTESSMLDVTGMTHFHIDVWSADFTQFSVKLVDFGADGAYGGGDDVEHLIDYASPAQGQWISYDIPLTDFTGLTSKEHIAQYLLIGQPMGATTVWVDNVYFYNDGGASAGGPSVAAPTPTKDPLDVVSIYSDAYTDITVDNFDVGWCGANSFTEVAIAGNNTLKKNAGIDCHGINFASNRQDLSEYTHIHFDFYTDDVDLLGDVFNVKLVDFAGTAAEVTALEVNINTGTTPGIVSGAWVSVDVDITSLGGVVANNLTRSDVAEFGITTTYLTNVWYDNIYFYK